MNPQALLCVTISHALFHLIHCIRLKTHPVVLTVALIRVFVPVLQACYVFLFESFALNVIKPNSCHGCLQKSPPLHF